MRRKKEGKKEEKRKKKERRKRGSHAGEEGKWSEKLHLLSKIYVDRAIGFLRSKRQSSSTRRELHVGTRIWGFRQTPKVGVSLLLWLFLV